MKHRPTILMTAALGLMAAGLVRFVRLWRTGTFQPSGAVILWLSLFLCNLAAVLVFWGNARFALAFEPFLLPVAGAWLTSLKPLLMQGGQNE